MIARNRSTRVSALALAAFGLACALSAFAEPPDCRHCWSDYDYCRISGTDLNACMDRLWGCQLESGCPVSLPPIPSPT